jgi:hypothetical protein
MKPKLLLGLALVLSGGWFGCSTAHRPVAASAPESKYATYDWRPMLKTSDWPDLAMKLKQSKVPTEAKAQILASSSLPRPVDARDGGLVVSALFQLARNDAELGNADDLIWEVREISARHGEEISGLAWVDAFTGKVKVLYPK